MNSAALACSALLQEILVHPERDDLRLIYADALTDSGQEEQGEFIRVQVEIAQLEKILQAQGECHCCEMDGKCPVCRRARRLPESKRSPQRNRLLALHPRETTP